MADGAVKRLRTAADQLSAAMVSGNVMTSNNDEAELMELSGATLQAQEQHAASLKALEAKQRAAAIVVPTKDEEVKLALRSIGAPICLFGERLIDRRERLKRLIAEREIEAEISGKQISVSQILGGILVSPPTEKPREERQTTSFFTEASDALIIARQAMCSSSWARARSRLLKEYNTPIRMDGADQSKSVRLEMTASLNEPRPISACSFLGQDHIVTSSFDEKCRIYRAGGDYGLVNTLIGHSERVCDVVTTSVSSSHADLIASGSAEGQIRIWNGATTRAILEGHVQRIGRLVFDPTGRWLVSTSFDRTWRLWDIETSSSLLTQDGYVKEVFATAFHPDGNLIAACDLGAACLVWDLRLGKVTHQFSGHVLGILAADFSWNGYYMATGGLDNQARIWDLRKRECLQIVPAHMKTISRLKFSSEEMNMLVTSSHDQTVRLWDCKSWKRLSSLVVHDGPVLGMDVTGNIRIVTSGYDKTLKIIDASVRSIGK